MLSVERCSTARRPAPGRALVGRHDDAPEARGLGERRRARRRGPTAVLLGDATRSGGSRRVEQRRVHLGHDERHARRRAGSGSSGRPRARPPGPRRRAHCARDRRPGREERDVDAAKRVGTDEADASRRRAAVRPCAPSRAGRGARATGTCALAEQPDDLSRRRGSVAPTTATAKLSPAISVPEPLAHEPTHRAAADRRFARRRRGRRCGGRRRARRRPRARSRPPPPAARASSGSSIAAERIAASGFALSCPAMSGAEPWIGS